MFLTKLISKITNKNSKQPIDEMVKHVSFRVVVVEFADNVESTCGEFLANNLQTIPGIEIQYFNEPFQKDFLDLESRNLFDFIDKGQTILDKTNPQVMNDYNN